MHLEQDQRPGWGPELRLLADTGEGLIPVPVHLDQPTLAWSAAEVTRLGGGLPPGIAQTAPAAARLLAWWVWPLIGTLLDTRAALARTAVLDSAGAAPDVRGAEVWEISYGLRPV